MSRSTNDGMMLLQTTHCNNFTINDDIQRLTQRPTLAVSLKGQNYQQEMKKLKVYNAKC